MYPIGHNEEDDPDCWRQGGMNLGLFSGHLLHHLWHGDYIQLVYKEVQTQGD